MEQQELAIKGTDFGRQRLWEINTQVQCRLKYDIVYKVVVHPHVLNLAWWKTLNRVTEILYATVW